MIKVVKAELFHIRLATKFVFKTSFGEIKNRDTIIVKLTLNNGIVGYGESAPLSEPVYLEESIGTCKHIINDFLFPIVLGNNLTPKEFVEKTSHFRGNRIAKYGIECALWMIRSQLKSKSIKKLLNSKRTSVCIGESIGLLDSQSERNELIKKRINQGYKRIKLKISPDHDVEVIKNVRKTFPNLSLMVDANSAYSLKDIDVLKELDKYNLLMIEQPLGFDDIIDHAKLQVQIKTPICLDESIVSYEHARKAIELGACKIINVKPGRIGSLYETIRINKLAKKNNIKLWCGGMLEAGIANAFNIYAASLSEFKYPADIFLSNKIFEQDIISPIIDMKAKGEIEIPDKIGLGFKVNEEVIIKNKIDYMIVTS